MAGKVQCATHGEREKTYVCSHLVGNAAALGFNRDDPSDDKPFPDAWCDNCELIRAAHNGWNDESQKLAAISLLCSACYERARIRNTRTVVTLEDLADLRWKCGSCEEWHRGPCLDFSYDSPEYWIEQYEEESHHASLLLSSDKKRPATFLNDDYCAIKDRDFFVRGIIELPIIGAAESLRWGVWGSLSRENFETLIDMEADPKRTELPQLFSWLSTRIPEYPNTLNMKMHARIPAVDEKPQFELELTDHPLAQEFHNGIAPERVKEIMMGRLREYQ
jgi:hypothetical protein